MAEIKILKSELLLGDMSNTDIYPVTSTRAVFDINNKNVDTIIDELTKSTNNKVSNINIKIVSLLNNLDTVGVEIDTINETLSDIVSKNSVANDIDFCFNNANDGDKNVRIEGTEVIIESDGFGVIYKGKYYYVANTTGSTLPYRFDLNQISASNYYLVLCTSQLSKINQRNELSNVITVKKGDLFNDGDIALCYYYSYFNYGVMPLGKFKDYFFKSEVTPTPVSNEYPNETLFEPEFYAYKWGKNLNTYGEGTGWYERFTIAHVSDVHRCNDSLKEAMQVANKKADLMINNGDESIWINADKVYEIKSDLNKAMSVVRENFEIPYLATAGNHDVPNLTKLDYFSRITAPIAELTDIQLGDSANYKSYGYYTLNKVMNNTTYKFMVIMLDPFDYGTSTFGHPYEHMSCVFSLKLIDWFITTLRYAAQNNYHVITTMHYGFGSNDGKFSEEIHKSDCNWYQDWKMIPNIIEAALKNRDLITSYTDKAGHNDINVVASFSNLPKLKYICHLYGHIHSKNEYQCQDAATGKKYNILMLGETSLGAYGPQYVPPTQDRLVGTALNKVFRVKDSINEIAFSMLLIDPIEQCIYRTSYGAYLNYDKSNSERTIRIPYTFNNTQEIL